MTAHYSKPLPELLERAFRRPPCFTPAQWDEWKTACLMSKPPKLDTYCADCTPKHKAKNGAVGKCCWPDVVFRIDSGEGLVGVRPSMRSQPNAMRVAA